VTAASSAVFRRCRVTTDLAADWRSARMPRGRQRAQSGGLRRVFKPPVIARRVRRAVAIQLDCFVVPQDGTPRNASLKTRRSAVSEKFVADWRSLLAGDFLPTATDYIPNRLPAGSSTRISIAKLSWDLLLHDTG
jgi:hypothetical protein